MPASDPRVESLKKQLGTYAGGDTLDLNQGTDGGAYEPQFTQPSPWGDPIDKAPVQNTEPAPAPPQPAEEKPAPRRRRWPAKQAAEPTPPPPEQPVPSPPVADETGAEWLKDVRVDMPQPRSKQKLTFSSATVRRMTQDLPWCAVAIWLHIAVAGAPPWALIAFGAALYLATLFWIWLLLEQMFWLWLNLKKRNPWPAIAAAVALSAIPLAIQQPILYTLPLTVSYALADGNHWHGQWVVVFSRVLIAISLSWPIAALILSTNLF